MMSLCPNPNPSFLHLHHHRHRHRRRPFFVRSLDAAQSFDFESRAVDRLNAKSKLKIAVVGFGNYGQFLARTFAAQGHTLLAHSRSDHSAAAAAIGASFFRDPHDLCEQHPDVVLLSTSILSAADVLNTLPLGRLRRSTLFADVLSVKEFPRNLLLSALPPDFDILCTHPMFGPESARHGWAGLPFVFDKVRIGESEERISRCNRFLEIFEKEGCRMVEMSCAEHDHKTAESQFLTHTIGRILAKLGPEDVDIGTKGYQTLLELVQNTCNDSFDLYNGLFMYNKNATELLDRLDFAFTELKKELFGNLHDILRKQLFENPEESNELIPVTGQVQPCCWYGSLKNFILKV
ncbi:arogenate dehydrogenase 2, chloroplastic-like isoform X1 [Dioscorea cayenensis subsp. rotundata]|uniref:Arogenate dehydrogenase 2, chloroplastic-like isoform X1 n=1 Tax=Dioscorea cayennensis subsp. rotundata TaxID=55577 RepID=A0AB40AS99_DIOCR|nr:arogenate dehydrogenase 2, chloroplastic-like isoform X1 [Dioscorea cayenensis subsp. rotundata]